MADNKITLQIITPMRMILDEQVDSVIMTTVQGDMAVLYDHEPLVTLLAYKHLTYKQGEVRKSLTVMGGFAEVTSDKVVVLTDASELEEEIDLERAKKAKERAEKRLNDSTMDQERAEVALKKALARISLVSK